MGGLPLSERYYRVHGRPLVAERFPELLPRLAAGVVGEGAECYGLGAGVASEDAWGTGFCLWLTEEDVRRWGDALREALAELPAEFAGLPVVGPAEWGGRPVGVFSIGRFFRQFIGQDVPPLDWREWRRIPEPHLALCTNGRVFEDNLGEFSYFQTCLLAFYPEDVRRHKIAARCMSAGQAGQRVFGRSARRGDWVAAATAECIFTRDVISLVFLLNRRYRPFYQWMHRVLADLPLLGPTIRGLTHELAVAGDGRSLDRTAPLKERLIEKICGHLAQALRAEGLSDVPSHQLMEHGPAVQDRIGNPEIHALGVWAE